MSTIDRVYKRLNGDYAFIFFQITVIGDLEIDGKVHKNIRQRNNDSIITTNNWEQHKDVFFNERMATYEDSYTIKEKIKLELEILEKLPINEDMYKVLKDRYLEYLRNLKPIQQVEFTFKNEFDLINEIEIFTHFKIGLVESKMLSISELKKFLKASFENKKPPKKRFILKNVTTRKYVHRVFYEYYTNVAGKPHGKQKEYAKLLGEYFQGYNSDTVKTNFSKSTY
jgi:hypothetical protein